MVLSYDMVDMDKYIITGYHNLIIVPGNWNESYLLRYPKQMLSSEMAELQGKYSMSPKKTDCAVALCFVMSKLWDHSEFFRFIHLSLRATSLASASEMRGQN